MEWHNDNRISIPSDSTLHIVCILFNYKWRTLYIFASDCDGEIENSMGEGWVFTHNTKCSKNAVDVVIVVLEI